MKYLSPRLLQGIDGRWDAIGAAGGLYVADPSAAPEALRQEVIGGNVRALEVHADDLTWLEGLPLEFVVAHGGLVDITPIRTLRSLRGLSVDAWVGDLDLSHFPLLRWFGVSEVEKGQLDRLYETGHPTLEMLEVGKYREADLTSLSRLTRLQDLSIVDSRSLASLSGIGALPNLRLLDLHTCPQLATVEGIQSATMLRAIVLTTCNRIEDLAPVRSLPDLKVVQIEMRHPPSLQPLVGHDSVEFVWVIGGKPPPGEIELLSESPAMRMVNSNRASWMRADDGWIHVDNIYAMTTEQLELHETLLADLNRLKTL